MIFVIFVFFVANRFVIFVFFVAPSSWSRWQR